jgi:DNA-binding PadR family transcriptional regulator
MPGPEPFEPFEPNATAASVLGFLLDGARTGWEIAEVVEHMLGDFWNVTRSQIYRELKTLEREGLVEGGSLGARERRPFTLTDAGRAAFQRWLELDPGPDNIRIPLLLKLFFADHLDDATASRWVTAHRAVHAANLAGYRELLPDLEDNMPAVARVLHFGIAYEEAVLSWFDTLPWPAAAAR